MNLEFDSVPKRSEGINNKDVILNVPDNLKSLVPEGFNFNELDQKFSYFIKFLFISKKNISKKKFKFLVQGLFNILTELGVNREIKNMYKKFLSSDVENIDLDNEIYNVLALEILENCERRLFRLDMNS
jgi:hypothetical protein